MGQKIIKWSTDNIPHLAPHLTYPDIDKSFFLVLLHIPRVFKDHIFILHPERFYPRIHQCGQFLWSVVLCRNPRSSDKRQHSGFAGEERWCRRKGGRSACGALFWRGNKIESQATLAETSHKAVWSPFYRSASTAPNSWALAVSLQSLPATLSFIVAKKSFLHGRRSVGDPSSEVFRGSVNPGSKVMRGYPRASKDVWWAHHSRGSS